jgi:dihydrodipicolinate synthase/N-acetylneuraminate lyase
LRHALVSETASGKGWNENAVKQLTGDTKMTARYMRQDFFEFTITHKLSVCTNNRPEVRENSHAFWRRFVDIPEVVAIKIAPFNRYQTIDVVRALALSGRTDLALYTGNDDTIVADLLTPFTFATPHGPRTCRIVGGLLGHWGVWTHAAVRLLAEIQAVNRGSTLAAQWLDRAVAVTDMNAALFDAANRFHGCIPGILEVLRRQGLVETILCLNPAEALSPGQAEELTRVSRDYPELIDDAFILAHRDRWLS